MAESRTKSKDWSDDDNDENKTKRKPTTASSLNNTNDTQDDQDSRMESESASQTESGSGSESGSESSSYSESDKSATAPLKRKLTQSSTKSKKATKKKTKSKRSDSDQSEQDSDSDSDSESHMTSKKETKSKMSDTTSSKKSTKSSSSRPAVKKQQPDQNTSSNNNRKRNISDVEEGEVSGSLGSSSSSDSSVFTDGYDSDFLGDEQDRKKLDALTEKEREEEIYRRTEQRDLLLKRFEMQKKIKQQQKDARRAQKQEARLERKRQQQKNRKVKEPVNKDKEDIVKPNNSNLLNLDSRRKANESKRKDTEVSKALAHLKADREKKKQQAERLQSQQAKKLRTEDVFSSTSSSEQNSDRDDDDRRLSKKKSKTSKKSSSRGRGRPARNRSGGSNSGSDDDDNADSASGSASGPGSGQSESSNDDSDDDDEDKEENIHLKKLITCKEDLNKIKMSRFKIEKWCHAPFFKSVAQGCFVRVGIGLNLGNNIYRVAEVIDVVETAKVYSLGTTKTNKGFKLKHGEDQRTYRLEFISNQAFTDEEFNRWKDVMNKHTLTLPTNREISVKSKQLESFVNYRFKEQDIDFIVAEKKKFTKDTEGLTSKKMNLLSRREAAEQQGDLEQVRDINLQINSIDTKAVDQIDRRIGSFNKLAAINQRNREESNARVEDAMRKEYKRIQESGEDDPFQRRKGFPVMLNGGIKKKVVTAEKEVDDDDEAAAAEKQKDKPKLVEPKKVEYEDFLAPVVVKKNDESMITSTSATAIFKNMLPGTLTPLFNNHNENENRARKVRISDDLFDDHNFEINIDLAVPISTNQLQPVNTGSLLNSGLSRRSLNLDEYKKKKGLI